MTDLDIENKEVEIMLTFQAGQAAFERGQYREAVEILLKTHAMSDRNSVLGGEVQIWLVTAYEAIGQRKEALALCRQLKVHPARQVRKQSKRLLYIMEAPKLEKRSDWLTQIPDLDEVNERDLKQRMGVGSKDREGSERWAIDSEPVDLSQVNTHDGGFIWIALGMISVILGGLFWLR